MKEKGIYCFYEEKECVVALKRGVYEEENKV